MENRKVTYGGIKQRWLIVESEARKISDLDKLEQKIEQELVKTNKLLSQLQKKEFEHPSQISYQVNGINKKLKFFTLQEIEGSASTKCGIANQIIPTPRSNRQSRPLSGRILMTTMNPNPIKIAYS